MINRASIVLKNIDTEKLQFARVEFATVLAQCSTTQDSRIRLSTDRSIDLTNCLEWGSRGGGPFCRDRDLIRDESSITKSYTTIVFSCKIIH